MILTLNTTGRTMVVGDNETKKIEILQQAGWREVKALDAKPQTIQVLPTAPTFVLGEQIPVPVVMPVVEEPQTSVIAEMVDTDLVLVADAETMPTAPQMADIAEEENVPIPVADAGVAIEPVKSKGGRGKAKNNKDPHAWIGNLAEPTV